MVDGITKDVSDIDVTIVIFEVNLVGSNPKEWWIDTDVTRHVCLDKKCWVLGSLPMWSKSPNCEGPLVSLI